MATGAAALIAVLGAQPAVAAPAAAISCQASNHCHYWFQHPGGALYIDLDAISLGPDTASAGGAWTAYDDRDNYICSARFRVEAPAQTFSCGSRPAGVYNVYANLDNQSSLVDWRLGAHH